VQILRLSIKRYRGLADFDWQPAPTANCLIGPGNSGKSTVLAAISLLLAPYPATSASEFDYLDRNVTGGFEIEASLAVGEDVLSTERLMPPLWGWRDGKLVELPEDGTKPVMVVRARGTADLEIVHEIIPPAGDPVTFSVGFRKKLLLARLAGEDRAARDLRVTQGSMLDRFLGRTELRGVLASAIAAASRGLAMPDDVTASLRRLAYSPLFY
jgi:putative ATP-dependent endonuclease of the OLD family